METLPVVMIVRFRSIVSNPLGWDGDINAIKTMSSNGYVSNPLGWDGDRVLLPTAPQDIPSF